VMALARRWWGIAVLVAGVLVATYLTRDVPNYPANQAAEYRTRPAVQTAVATVEPKDRLAFEKDLLQYETDNQIKIWTGIVQAIGASVLAIGAYFTWRNLRVANEAQITNRFTQAIGQLGAELKEGEPNLEVRLGGIYALERIARDSPPDDSTIMEILTAYVRKNAPWSPSSTASSIEGPVPPTDIQAILTVIGRRTPPKNSPGLDLQGTDLRGASALKGAHLEKAFLRGAHLERADLRGAHLKNTNLSEAYLPEADLRRADLQETSLLAAHLDHAKLHGAHLQGALLNGADLRNAAFFNEEEGQKQVYSAHKHGDGASLPTDWHPSWRDQFSKRSRQ
jgi:hypothetical protein